MKQPTSSEDDLNTFLDELPAKLRRLAGAPPSQPEQAETTSLKGEIAFLKERELTHVTLLRLLGRFDMECARYRGTFFGQLLENHVAWVRKVEIAVDKLQFEDGESRHEEVWTDAESAASCMETVITELITSAREARMRAAHEENP